MNEIVNKFILVGDTFVPEMDLKQPDFTYSVCGIFNKNKEKIEKFMETGNTKRILIKLVFNMIRLMVNLKIWIKEHNSIKFSEIKPLKLQVIQNTMDIKEDGLQVFDKKSTGSGIKNEIKQNRQLSNELHKPIIRNFKKSLFII